VLVREVTEPEDEEAGRVVAAAYGALPGGHMTAVYTSELADVAGRSKEAEVLVAVDDTVIGCVTFVPGPASPWAELLEDGESAIRMLAVDPGFQGRGVGRALVQSCIERARRLGSRALVLHTTPWMTAAHHLYEHAGFVRIPGRDWTPEPGVPLLGFRLSLEGSSPEFD